MDTLNYKERVKDTKTPRISYKPITDYNPFLIPNQMNMKRRTIFHNRIHRPSIVKQYASITVIYLSTLNHYPPLHTNQLPAIIYQSPPTIHHLSAIACQDHLIICFLRAFLQGIPSSLVRDVRGTSAFNDVRCWFDGAERSVHAILSLRRSSKC